MQSISFSFAQQVSISKSNASLKTILKDIKKQTNFDFLLTSSQLKKAKPVDLRVENMALDAVLHKIFADQPLSYSISNKMILIKEKKVKADKNKESIKPSSTQQLVSGRLLDQNRKPLVGATVKFKNIKTTVFTDKSGNFTIQYNNDQALIQFSYVGYATKELTIVEIISNPTVRLTYDSNTLNEVNINRRRVVGTKVDLKHRKHQSLAQVLEGGVAGISVRSGRSTTSSSMLSTSSGTISIAESYEGFRRSNPTQITLYPTLADYERAWKNGVIKLQVVNTKENLNLKTKTSTSNLGVVLEQRGAGSFAGQTNGMLLVIDGFVQDEVDPNMPLNNVESLEIIRDPVECLKWGPKASAGVILIKTNIAQAGKIQISYNSNFYFSKPPDLSREKLRQASSADLLDYYREVYDKGLATYVNNSTSGASFMPLQLNLAERLLFKLKSNALTADQFNYKWDSLGNISNTDQLRLLQRNSFNQNHALAISGGIKNNLFSLNTTYGREQSLTPGAFNERYGINLKNSLSFFEDKLKVDLITTFQNSRSRIVDGNSGQNMEPYQLLLGPAGEYLYDYTSFDPDRNAILMQSGFLDNGVNLLEDLRNSKNTSKSQNINTNLNIGWQISPHLKWLNSISYVRGTNRGENWQGAASSAVRQLLNNYTSPVYDPANRTNIDGIQMYVPPGDLLTQSRGSNSSFNTRSGLLYNKVFGTAHILRGSVDAGVTSGRTNNYPASTIYGYDPIRGTGLPILGQLAQSSPSALNYLGGVIYTNKLLVSALPSIGYNRNLTLNGKLDYSYLNRYTLNANFSRLFAPSYGENPPYTETGVSALLATWTMSNEAFFKAQNWLSDLKLYFGAAHTQIPKLRADQVLASRSVQPIWNNAAITIANFNNKTQLNGQANKEFKVGMEAGFLNNNLLLNLSLSHHSTTGNFQWNGRIDYKIAEEPWFDSDLISSLNLSLIQQDINPFQGLSVVLEANSLSDGGFAIPLTLQNNGLLPPEIRNKEVGVQLGILEDRHTLNLRYYNKRVAGLSNGDLPTDPATGLTGQIVYSEIQNKGLEITLTTTIIKNDNFNWNINLNGAYNVNKAIDVPKTQFSLAESFFNASRNGYSTDNLWSLKWAGLDTKGDPQVYNKDMVKISSEELGRVESADELNLVYLGRIAAPWTGGLIQQWNYKNFFASARLVFNMGHVMRTYKPLMNSDIDQSIAIRDRWRKPGDEVLTDIAAIAKDNPIRELMIRNSDNGIVSADHIRFSEIQLGYDLPSNLFGGKYIKNISISGQVRNLGVWAFKNGNLDPQIVSNYGLVGPALPREYSLSVQVDF
ncbi:carboxypeptidase-like protein [Sphingobacterium sp. JUb20]|nr:carboxypeptidase-like protein [Sphingobacterium sp. JUb20]